MCDMIALQISARSTTDGRRSVAIAEPIQMRVLDENDMCRQLEPTLRISPEEAQGLMDELWRAGIRPTEGAGSVGQLAAVNRHLEDMRSLVFKTTKK